MRCRGPRLPPASSVKGILKHGAWSLGVGDAMKTVRFELPDGSQIQAEETRVASTGYSGSELYQFYVSTCTRRDLHPWPQLLKQMKVIFVSVLFCVSRRGRWQMATNEKQRLHTIDLKGVNIMRRDAEVFVEMVMNNPSLRRLNLEHTNLDDEVLDCCYFFSIFGGLLRRFR